MLMDQNRVDKAVDKIVDAILEYEKAFDHYFAIAGIPSGGMPVAIQIAVKLGRPCSAVNAVGFTPDPEKTLIVDDLIDSGETIQPWLDKGYLCAVLGTKSSFKPRNKIRTGIKRSDPFKNSNQIISIYDFPNEWIQFWWEPRETDDDPKKQITRILQFIGEDTNRNGLLETPDRVVRSWSQIYGGYDIDPKSVFKEFDEPVSDDLVIMRNISFSSTCEHHMLPFMGKAHIAYIPKGNKVIGASKMIRLLEIYAHRLQIQERIAQQVCDALEKYLDCSGCACVIEAVHSCISCRGVGNASSELVTPVLRGDFRAPEKVALRAELYANISRT